MHLWNLVAKMRKYSVFVIKDFRNQNAMECKINKRLFCYFTCLYFESAARKLVNILYAQELNLLIDFYYR